MSIPQLMGEIRERTCIGKALCTPYLGDMPSKRQNSDLYDLIRSMTPSEKRHFRLNTDPLTKKGKGAAVRDLGSTSKQVRDANQYMLLFEALEQQEAYDEAAAQKKLKLKDKARFNRIRSYLYKVLLESLEDYYRENTLDAQFYHLMNRIDILLRKRLFGQASKLIRKAEKLAQEKGNGSFAMLVETLELSRLAQQEHFKPMEDRLDAYPAFREDQLQRSGDFLDLQMIKCKATWLLRHGKRDRVRRQAWLEELKAHRLMVSNPYPEDTEFTLYHFNLNGLIHSLIGDAEKDFHFRKAYLDTYRAHPEYIKRWPQNYIVALGNVAGACPDRQDFQQLLACTTEMRAFRDQHNIKNATTLDALVETRSWGFELDAYPVMGLDARKRLHGEIQTVYKQHGKGIAEIWRLILEFGLGRYELYHGNPELAADWFNRIMHQSDEKIYPGLQAATRVLDVVMHYRAGHHRYLDGQLPKVRQWLRNRDIGHPALLGLLSSLGKGMRDAAQQGLKLPEWPEDAWAILCDAARSPQPDWGDGVTECFRQLDPQSWIEPGYALKNGKADKSSGQVA